MAKNLLIAQSGGPTAAINATLAGIVERALTCGQVDKIYGAIGGTKGILAGNIAEIGEQLSSPRDMARLIHTPSAALGSCRLKLADPAEDSGDFEAILQRFEEYDIGYFLCIGGNDSMDTVAKLTAYMRANGVEGISVMGAPKTIDNDLCGMDHSPGFPSAARYVATTFSELWCDCRVYDTPAVTIVEVMGRSVGWLAASAGLAKVYCDAPNLIYLPEVPFDEESFLEDVRAELQKGPAVLIAVSEGVKHADGSYVSQLNQTGIKDDFGHKYLSGAGKVLENLVRREIGCKARSLELSLMQRCAAHLTSPVDLDESRMLGMTALDCALQGESGRVSVLRRISDSPYRVEYSTIPVEQVANLEKPVPREWINEEGNFIAPPMLNYLAPLIAGEDDGRTRHGLPVHLRLF
ncbi:MAG: 6-phosphofructokinase [Oscillospiraceae bacterium]